MAECRETCIDSALHPFEIDSEPIAGKRLFNGKKYLSSPIPSTAEDLPNKEFCGQEAKKEW